MYLRRFRLKEFIKPHENASAYPELPGAYSICSICPIEDEDTAEILAKIVEFGKIDRQSFRNAMQKLLKIANSGQRFEVNYDDKQCHETHSY